MEFLKFLGVLAIMLAAGAVIGVIYAIASAVKEAREKEKARRQLFGVGSADEDYHPDFTVDNILSIDHNSRKIRPECYPGCMTFSFSDIISVYLFDDISYYSTTRNHGTTANTIIGGMLAGEIGAIAGATSGTQITTTNSNRNGWILIINTTVLHHKRLEIKLPVYGKYMITDRGTRKSYSSRNTAEKIKFQLEELDSILHSVPQPVKATDDIALIRKYKQLFDEGILTEEEFTAKKKKILGI